MTKRRVPKLKPIDLSRYIMDLLMASEGDKAAIREERVRVIWHVLFFSICVFVLAGILGVHIVRSFFPDSSNAAVAWRSFLVLFYVYLLSLLFLLCFRHYLYLLRTGKDLRFKPIGFFYFIGIIFFGKLYNSIFFLKPELFEVIDPILKPAPNLMYLGIKAFINELVFYVYSACTVVSIEYPRIRSSSTIVSTINVVEVLYGIMIIVLLVATFVQKSDHSKSIRRFNKSIDSDAV